MRRFNPNYLVFVVFIFGFYFLIPVDVPNEDYEFADPSVPWIVLAGDSNMRGIFHDFNYTGSRIIVGRNKAHTCDHRWADQEFIYDDKVITMRFMTRQYGILRMDNNMYNSTYCGSELLKKVPNRSPFPDLIWFAHGLWGVGNRTATCVERFKLIIPVLKRWSKRTRVVWQTNFKIQKHKSISNEYLEWEISCQRLLAKKYGIELFDLDAVVKTHENSVKGFHLTHELNHVVGNYINDLILSINNK